MQHEASQVFLDMQCTLMSKTKIALMILTGSSSNLQV